MIHVERRARYAVVACALVAMMVVAAVWLVSLLRHPPFRGSAEQWAYAPREATSGPLPKLWDAPAFSFVDQHRQSVSLATLRGRPFVADFIFTECTSACPMMTARMVLVQRALADEDVAFVSFSVDPAHDSPAALADYARKWNERERRWTLLSTDATSLPDVLTGFRIMAKDTSDPANPIVHSSVFLLVDGEGSIRGAYDSNDEHARARLVADVRAIAVRAPRITSAVEMHEAPMDLVHALGCAGCHDKPQIAPPLLNLIGAERTLADGTKVHIDEAYLRRAILKPGAEIVKGHAPLMPSYASQLTDAQLDALIAELVARRSDAPAPAADAALVTDPVCHMTVRTDALHVRDHDHDYYFCSPSCRDAFVANPAKYRTNE